jgi:hypothetical protein
LSKNKPGRAEINEAHEKAAFSEGGFFASRSWAGTRAKLEPKRFHLRHGAGVKSAVVNKGLAKPDGLVGEENGQIELAPAVVHLGQAIVPIEVLGLSQGQFLEDLFGAWELIGLEGVEAIVPPVVVVFFGERTDEREFTPYAAEMIFEGGRRRTVVMARHGGIVPHIGRGLVAGRR